MKTGTTFPCFSKAAVISERKIFREFFATNSRRRWGEEAIPYRVRREEEYTKMKTLLPDVVIPERCRNFFLLDGAWYRQRVANEHAEGVEEGGLFHFQVWKAAYKRLRYGEHGMQTVQPGRSFKLMKHGIFPLD